MNKSTDTIQARNDNRMLAFAQGRASKCDYGQHVSTLPDQHHGTYRYTREFRFERGRVIVSHDQGEETAWECEPYPESIAELERRAPAVRESARRLYADVLVSDGRRSYPQRSQEYWQRMWQLAYDRF